MENQNTQLQRVEPQGTMQNAAYGIAEVKYQQGLIRDLLKTTLVVGVHYGVIPGCGDKMAILKPGAEKIGVLFRLAPFFETNQTDLPNGHREVNCICTLKNIVTGQTWGQGIGAATSMENKYRFQTKNTGRAVPEEYWKTRDKDLIGGSHCMPKKIGGVYVVIEMSENENPLDKLNTYVKIAAKRAHVAAILLCTAASDIFITDEEFEEANDPGTMPTEAEAAQTPADSAPRQTLKPAPKAAPAPRQGANQAAPASGFEGDWASVVIHWGQARGTRLGDLPKNKLWFFATKWEPQRDPAGKIKGKEDAIMKAAAIAGHAEVEKAEKEQAAERGDDNPMP